MAEEINWDNLNKMNSKFSFSFKRRLCHFTIDVNISGQENKKLNLILPEGDQTYVGTLAGICKKQFNFFDLKPKDGTNIIDMGCNYGLISMICATLYPQCTIHAFDPCKDVFQFMMINCFVNNIKNIVFHNTAVTTSQEENLNFCSNIELGRSCFVESKFYKEGMTHVGKCKNTHIKNVLDEIKNICYFKMDIEGAEHDIFNYLFENNKDFQDTIPYRVHIEVHGEDDKKENLINKLNKVFVNDKNIISI
jgi:FkbM family methyltransferase